MAFLPPLLKTNRYKIVLQILFHPSMTHTEKRVHSWFFSQGGSWNLMQAMLGHFITQAFMHVLGTTWSPELIYYEVLKCYIFFLRRVLRHFLEIFLGVLLKYFLVHFLGIFVWLFLEHFLGLILGRFLGFFLELSRDYPWDFFLRLLLASLSGTFSGTLSRKLTWPLEKV